MKEKDLPLTVTNTSEIDVVKLLASDLQTSKNNHKPDKYNLITATHEDDHGWFHAIRYNETTESWQYDSSYLEDIKILIPEGLRN